MSWLNEQTEATLPQKLTPALRSFNANRDPASFRKRRAFCPQCGSPVFLTNSARPEWVVLYAASLDDPSWVRPARDIYTASAQPWDTMDPALPKFPRMPQR